MAIVTNSTGMQYSVVNGKSTYIGLASTNASNTFTAPKTSTSTTTPTTTTTSSNYNTYNPDTGVYINAQGAGYSTALPPAGVRIVYGGGQARSGGSNGSNKGVFNEYTTGKPVVPITAGPQLSLALARGPQIVSQNINGSSILANNNSATYNTYTGVYTSEDGAKSSMIKNNVPQDTILYSSAKIPKVENYNGPLVGTARDNYLYAKEYDGLLTPEDHIRAAKLQKELQDKYATNFKIPDYVREMIEATGKNYRTIVGKDGIERVVIDNNENLANELIANGIPVQLQRYGKKNGYKVGEFEASVNTPAYLGKTVSHGLKDSIALDIQKQGYIVTDNVVNDVIAQVKEGITDITFNVVNVNGKKYAYERSYVAPITRTDITNTLIANGVIPAGNVVDDVLSQVNANPNADFGYTIVERDGKTYAYERNYVAPVIPVANTNAAITLNTNPIKVFTEMITLNAGNMVNLLSNAKNKMPQEYKNAIKTIAPQTKVFNAQLNIANAAITTFDKKADIIWNDALKYVDTGKKNYRANVAATEQLTYEYPETFRQATGITPLKQVNKQPGIALNTLNVLSNNAPQDVIANVAQEGFITVSSALPTVASFAYKLPIAVDDIMQIPAPVIGYAAAGLTYHLATQGNVAKYVLTGDINSAIATEKTITKNNFITLGGAIYMFGGGVVAATEEWKTTRLGKNPTSALGDIALNLYTPYKGAVEGLQIATNTKVARSLRESEVVLYGKTTEKLAINAEKAMPLKTFSLKNGILNKDAIKLVRETVKAGGTVMIRTPIKSLLGTTTSIKMTVADFKTGAIVIGKESKIIKLVDDTIPLVLNDNAQRVIPKTSIAKKLLISAKSTELSISNTAKKISNFDINNVLTSFKSGNKKTTKAMKAKLGPEYIQPKPYAAPKQIAIKQYFVDLLTEEVPVLKTKDFAKNSIKLFGKERKLFNAQDFERVEKAVNKEIKDLTDTKFIQKSVKTFDKRVKPKIVKTIKNIDKKASDISYKKLTEKQVEKLLTAKAAPNNALNPQILRAINSGEITAQGMTKKELLEAYKSGNANLETDILSKLTEVSTPIEVSKNSKLGKFVYTMNGPQDTYNVVNMAGHTYNTAKGLTVETFEKTLAQKILNKPARKAKASDYFSESFGTKFAQILVDDKIMTIMGKSTNSKGGFLLGMTQKINKRLTRIYNAGTTVEGVKSVSVIDDRISKAKKLTNFGKKYTDKQLKKQRFLQEAEAKQNAKELMKKYRLKRYERPYVYAEPTQLKPGISLKGGEKPATKNGMIMLTEKAVQKTQLASAQKSIGQSSVVNDILASHVANMESTFTPLVRSMPITMTMLKQTAPYYSVMKSQPAMQTQVDLGGQTMMLTDIAKSRVDTLPGVTDTLVLPGMAPPYLYKTAYKTDMSNNQKNITKQELLLKTQSKSNTGTLTQLKSIYGTLGLEKTLGKMQLKTVTDSLIINGELITLQKTAIIPGVSMFVPVFGPTLPIIGGVGGAGSGGGNGRHYVSVKQYNTPLRYAPSLAAIIYGITSVNTPLQLTGLEVRPIIVSPRVKQVRLKKIVKMKNKKSKKRR